MARVTVVGSADAFSSAGRGNACFLVEDGAAPYAVDFGPTAIQGLGRLGRDPDELDLVLLTHLHGDHFLGTAMLFVDLVYRAKRTRPLTIAGPPGTEARVREAWRVAYVDASRRPLPFDVRFVEIAPGERREVCGRRVRAERAHHQLGAEGQVALSYRVEAGGRALAYSGDTGWTGALADLARGADLLLVECTSLGDPYPEHLSWTALAPRLAELGARRVLLVHLGADVRERAAELPVELADDGRVVEV